MTGSEKIGEHGCAVRGASVGSREGIPVAAGESRGGEDPIRPPDERVTILSCW